jgi:glucose-1-phosphate thymidylyltransferase
MAMKGVILAAGKGTRLYPVTKAIPKPILPLAGRITLDYAFEQFRACGISEACVVVGETGPKIEEAVGDGSSFGLRVSYATQTEPKGLAHAVGFARDFVGEDDFMLYLGDAIYDRSLAPFAEQFRTSGAANLNLVKHVEDPRRFGVANIEDGRIVKLVEKPTEPESNWAMAGMYIFGPQIWSVLPDLAPSARGEFEITDAIQMLVDRGGLVVPGRYEGEWFDTGTRESFLATSRCLISGGTQIAEDAQLFGDAGDSVVIGAGAAVRCASISDSVVLPGATVQCGGEIRGSILGGDVEADSLIDQIRWSDWPA